MKKQPDIANLYERYIKTWVAQRLIKGGKFVVENKEVYLNIMPNDDMKVPPLPGLSPDGTLDGVKLRVEYDGVFFPYP